MAQLDAARLNRELARRGLTGRDLARLAGVHEALISRARSGRAIRPSTLTRLTRALLQVGVLPGADLLLAGSEHENATEQVQVAV